MANDAQVEPEYQNRHSWRNKIARELWRVTWLLLFRPTPRGLHLWRTLLLRLFGARLGAHCAVLPSCRIWAPWNLEMGDHACLAEHVDCYCVDKITLEERVTVSQGTFLCTASHSITSASMELTTAPIRIGARAWVAARAIILPGVTIGPGAVVAAGAVVTKPVSDWTVVAGNPAKVVGTRKLSDP
ncbi:MAG TPA: DapH/DapD/GlmU-related protein [Polyangiaceae bacterium]|nr:DapH/DapD/GlmU-related protein [Polyangiaceae bacterium]